MDVIHNENTCFQDTQVQPLNHVLTNNRLKELLINAIEWSIEVSEQHTHDLLRATRITSHELEIIGYDKENFENIHEFVNE